MSKSEDGVGFASALRADSAMYRWALTLSKFADCADGDNFAAVCTPDGGVAKLTYGDARQMLRDLLDARGRLDRIASWHSLETGPGGLVGLYCIECGARHPCETRRMADGTHEDLTAEGGGEADRSNASDLRTGHDRCSYCKTKDRDECPEEHV